MEKTAYGIETLVFEMDAVSGRDFGTVHIREGAYSVYGRMDTLKGGLGQSLLSFYPISSHCFLSTQ